MPIKLPVYLPIKLPVYLPIKLPVYLPIKLPVYLPIKLSVYLPIKLPVYLPIKLPVIFAYQTTCLKWLLRVFPSGSGRGGISSKVWEGGGVIFPESRFTRHTSSGTLEKIKKFNSTKKFKFVFCLMSDVELGTGHSPQTLIFCSHSNLRLNGLILNHQAAKILKIIACGKCSVSLA